MAITKEKIVCIYCGETFEAEPWKHLRFCSRKCAAFYNKRLKYPVEKRVCQGCGKEFEFSPTNSNGLTGKFCSQDCHVSFQKKNIKLDYKVCKMCGKGFTNTCKTPNKEYCSISCYNNNRKIANNRTIEGIIVPNDYKCSRSFEQISNTLKSILSQLSRKPQQQVIHREYNELYNDIVTFPFKEKDLSFSDRFYLFLTSKEERPDCLICGKKTKYSKPQGKWGTTCSNACKNRLQTEQLAPNFNRGACEIFLQLDKELGSVSGVDSRYAMYGGGEICVLNAYWLDYINYKEKIIIEWHERNHAYTKKRDAWKRKQVMEQYPGYKYITIWEKHWGFESNMQKLLEEIKVV